jgi:predicted metal-dependent phosphoesterase TrpH
MATPRQVLDFAERRTCLNVVAVTDHDDLTPALRAAEIHARHGAYRFDLVSGMEVTTIEGHLLALFIQRQIPSFRTLAATLDAIHAQGGLAIIPHPMSPLTRSIGRHGIERILRRRADGVWFDGIELANQSPAGRWTARRARELNHAQFHLAGVGGSDAHYLPVIGSSFTEFDGDSAEALRSTILARTTAGRCGRQPTLREIGAAQVVLQTARGLWATPSKVLGRPAQRLLRSAGLAPAGGRGR